MPLRSSSGAAILANSEFAPFLQDEFNVSQFTSVVLAGSQTTAQAQSEQLREGVRQLELELAGEVTGKNKELLRSMKRMLDAEVALKDVVVSMDSLQKSVRRIRTEIAGPYEHIKARTTQLHNLHSIVELLRHLVHRIKLTGKLRAQMTAPTSTLDLPKAAKLITDIKAVDAGMDFTNIDVVEEDTAFIQAAAATVQEQAKAALDEGMECMSQAKVGSALQVFFNLDQLSQAVDSLLAQHLQQLDKAARSSLDPRHLGGGPGAAVAAAGLLGAAARGPTAAQPGAGASWQEKLWGGLREMADSLVHSASCVWHLQRVAAKKRDPLSHVCFLDVLVAPDQDLLCSRFWNEAVRVLAEVFAATAKPSTKAGFVRDALVAGYPKLAQLLETSFQKLLNETSIKGVMPAVTPDQLEQLLASTAPLQTAYLAGCLNRMSEAVAQAFPGGPRSLSSLTDVQKCIGVLHEELKAGSSCSMLAALVAGTAGKALALLAERAEYMAASGPDVRALSLGQPATAAQQRNIGLCSQLQEVLRSLTALLPRLPPSAAPALSNALDTLQAVAVELVAPLFRAVVEKVEDGLAKMHRVDFGPEGLAAAQHGGAEGDVTLTSPHITEVVALITHFRAEFLSRFVPVPSPAVPSCGTVLAERMAARTLVFFVRHASLVRPLGQAGKLQMAKDMAELQMAVGASLYPLEQLHQPYRVLKAFRSLIFSQPDAVLVSPLLRELPPSIVVHHLFGRLPASFQAPHERSGLSPAQYSLWLDSHSTDEVLRGIQTSLDVAGRSALEAAGPEAEEIVHVITSLCATTRL
ncbi:component of oligomeric golgi complex 5 [Haematococcus lacustris]